MDAEEPAVYTLTWRTARKAHHCCSCNFQGTPSRILPGHRYAEHRGLWDGQWSTLKRCARCERIAAAIERELPRDEWGKDVISIDAARIENRERIYNRHRWSKLWNPEEQNT